MNKSKSIVIFLFASLIALNCHAWNPFKKQSFEDCILENMRGVKSDDAAKEIRLACEIKSINNSSASVNSKKCVNRPLTTEEIKLVTGTAIVEPYGFLTVRVYNGNKNITINQVKVRLVDKENNKNFDFNMTNATVPPISTSGEMLANLLYAPRKSDWHMYDITTEVCK